MASIRLYRRFYKASCDGNGNDTYSLIDPHEISAESYLKDSATLIETVSTINRESLGIYFVDLTTYLYSYDYAYDLKWHIKYFHGQNDKLLITSFMLNPLNIVREIECEVEVNNEIEITIL